MIGVYADSPSAFNVLDGVVYEKRFGSEEIMLRNNMFKYPGLWFSHADLKGIIDMLKQVGKPF
jgi:hypothetical protein